MAPSTSTAVTATGRPTTDPAGPTGRLATWVAQTMLDDVPASVRDRAKHLVLDGIGCAFVGAQLPKGPAPALPAGAFTTVTCADDRGRRHAWELADTTVTLGISEGRARARP